MISLDLDFGIALEVSRAIRHRARILGNERTLSKELEKAADLLEGLISEEAKEIRFRAVPEKTAGTYAMGPNSS